ncbi:MAG: sortase [Ruminococcus flavefaciens]|nr:sortase [Ruminococcus flavefaciens]MCM1229370.1 sortase [Ruminococcus flavefaciens]
MKKTHGLCCILLGAILLIAALSLVLYNKNENEKGGEVADSIVAELKIELPETTTVTTSTTMENDLFAYYAQFETTTVPVIEEHTMELDGNIYIGIISVPALGLELPVMSEWSYPNLKLSPCRYKGTVADGNIIIAAHNYNTHFGRLNQLSGGEEIIFTDADGYPHFYEVAEVTEINGRDIEAMDFGSEDSWDLTLFTCTLSGQSRVTVRAVEKQE